MANLGAQLAREGWTLRSGGARGADTGFETGHRRATSERLEIYLPWRGFNKNESLLYSVAPEALQVAAYHHPAWESCSPMAQKLHGRNAYQVLGLALDAPSAFLVCWTKDGATNRKERSRDTGGTGTAIAIADAYGVPVFNLARKNALSDLEDLLAGRVPAKGPQ